MFPFSRLAWSWL